MNPGNTGSEKWKPDVSKNTLLLIAGILWIGIGIMLISLSYSWLKIERLEHAISASIIGFICALVIHHFGFLRIVDKNLGRILPLKERRCIFSFMPWKSYLIILIMMITGFFLRHSSIPKLYLSVLYIGIGTALVLSSIRYLRYLIMSFLKKQQL